MTCCVIYLTHGIVNGLLLSPWCAARGSFWNLPLGTTNQGQDWMLNWLSLSVLQCHVLLAGWAYTAVGNVVLEQRLITAVASLLVASLTAGVAFLPNLNHPMAALQAGIYGSLLAVLVWDQTALNTAAPMMAPATSAAMRMSPSAWRSSSFDARKKLPLSTLALALLCIVQLLRVVDFTFGAGQETYQHYNTYAHDAQYQSMSDMAFAHMLWVALVLGASVVGAVPAQQTVLLRGNLAALGATLWMLAGPQGDDMIVGARRAGVVGTFGAIVVSVVGSL